MNRLSEIESVNDTITLKPVVFLPMFVDFLTQYITLLG